MNKKQKKRLDKAIKILDFSDNWVYVIPWFTSTAMEYLAKTLGDVHVEYLDTEDGWAVSCCYEDKLWQDWKRSNSLTDVLAKAVIAADKKKRIE